MHAKLQRLLLLVLVLVLVAPSASQAFARSAPGSSEVRPVIRKIDPSRVVPLIRGARQIDGLPEAARKRLALRPLTDALYVVLAEDTGGTFVYLSPEEVASLRWAQEDEKVNAIINMAKLLPRFQINGSDGFFMIIAGGNYEASMLLAEPLWAKLKGKLKGRPVIAIPNRDMFIITGSEDAENLKELRHMVKSSFETGSEPVSDQLFIMGDDGFNVFK